MVLDTLNSQSYPRSQCSKYNKIWKLMINKKTSLVIIILKYKEVKVLKICNLTKTYKAVNANYNAFLQCWKPDTKSDCIMNCIKENIVTNSRDYSFALFELSLSYEIACTKEI